MAQHLALRKFDVAAAKDATVTVIIGKRNSGKSQMTADWLFHKRHIPVCVVMSNTEAATGFFKNTCGVPEAYIFNEWTPGAIDRFLDTQERKAKARLADPSLPISSCLIVLDDLAFDKSIFNSTQMRRLLMNGRHYHVTCVITAQYLGDLPTYFRTNVDYAVAYRTPGVHDRERLWKNFFGVVPSLHIFTEVLGNVTENYGCLVVDNNTQSNTFTDAISWYKAPLRSPTVGSFRVGCTVYRQYARARARREEESPDQPPPVPAATSRRPVINIKKMR